jgi:hypothetical protein
MRNFQVLRPCWPTRTSSLPRPGTPGREADRRLVNLLHYAARDVAQPPVALPADFEQHRKTRG